MSVADKDLDVQAPKGFPPTIGYTLTECLQDLLDFSAKHLCIQGRLVYFLPAIPDTCVGGNVPQHPALCLISNCEQVGNLFTSLHPNFCPASFQTKDR